MRVALYCGLTGQPLLHGRGSIVCEQMGAIIAALGIIIGCGDPKPNVPPTLMLTLIYPRTHFQTQTLCPNPSQHLDPNPRTAILILTINH